jgi:hypothetical protein
MALQVCSRSGTAIVTAPWECVRRLSTKKHAHHPQDALQRATWVPPSTIQPPTDHKHVNNHKRTTRHRPRPHQGGHQRAAGAAAAALPTHCPRTCHSHAPCRLQATHGGTEAWLVAGGSLSWGQEPLHDFAAHRQQEAASVCTPSCQQLECLAQCACCLFQAPMLPCCHAPNCP